MKPALRTLFVWLLLLALPVQGMAAARMLPCVDGADAQVAAPHAHQHAHAHAHAAMLRAMGHADAASTSACDHAGKQARGHGGACAACCIGVAPAPTPHLALAFGPPDFIAIPFRAGHITSVDPALPERPPRFPFA